MAGFAETLLLNLITAFKIPKIFHKIRITQTYCILFIIMLYCVHPRGVIGCKSLYDAVRSRGK